MLKDGIKEVSKIRLHSSSSCDLVSLQFFEGVAKLRYVLVITADLIHDQLDGKPDKILPHHFIDEVRECCTNKAYNTPDVGPGVFLLKQIYKKFGKAFLLSVTSNPAMEWIIPKHLRSTEVLLQ